MPKKKLNKNNEACRICKKTNHLQKDCFFRKKDGENAQEKVSFLACNDMEIDKWIVDSDTTAHMSNSNRNMKNFLKRKTEISVAKKNESISANGIGNIEFEECKLKDVMYVPDLNMNLLSVSAITNGNGEVTFTKNKVIITHNNQVVVTGNKTKGGLYEVDLQTEKRLNHVL